MRSGFPLVPTDATQSSISLERAPDGAIPFVFARNVTSGTTLSSEAATRGFCSPVSAPFLTDHHFRCPSSAVKKVL